jgi:hypothetical protein
MLTPRISEDVILHGKRDFSGVIKDTEMKRLSWWDQCDHKGPYKRKREAIETEKGKNEFRVVWTCPRNADY